MSTFDTSKKRFTSKIVMNKIFIMQTPYYYKRGPMSEVHRDAIAKKMRELGQVQREKRKRRTGFSTKAEEDFAKYIGII
jgi:hypothetical protein